MARDDQKHEDDRIAGWFDFVQDVKAEDEVIATDMDLEGCIQ